MKIRTGRTQVFTIGLFGMSAVMALLFSVSASAQSTTINVSVGTPLIDVCPNIPGAQPTVPGGMIINGSGDCVTPPPPVVDVCNNIPGEQSTIPAGYYQDSSGACLPQPSPPIDVCPNISGLQATVPTSLVVDESGNCIAPPIDECPNIEGPQSAVPEGMMKLDSVCFTPAPTTTTSRPDTPTQTTQQSRVTPVYKNVPPILSPLIEPLVEAVPEQIKEIVRSVPEDIARTVPYYVYAVLAITAGILMWQAIREMTATRALILLLKKERNIAEQKDNFLALASHYIRTPLTLMRNGIDTVVALKEISSTDLKPLRTTINKMDEDIKEIITEIESNEALKGISNPTLDAKHHRNVLRSGFFWGPIVGSIVLTLLSNFLLGIVADVDLGTANLLFQVIVITAISIVFYSAFRNHHIRKSQRSHQEKLVEHERAIDAARNEFIMRTTDVLRTGLTEVYNHRQLLGNAPSARFFDDGYLRFNSILEKFLLLGSIRAGVKVDVEKINLKLIVNDVIAEFSEQIDAKHLTLHNHIKGSINVEHNRALFEFVIRSVIDNAIKFNVDGGEIRIESDADSKQLVIHVNDNGIGIPKDKLAQLFKPFSRADSALQFNYEGLGFSLFLDKIIADYMGGTIDASSSHDKGTSITLRTNTAFA